MTPVGPQSTAMSATVYGVGITLFRLCHLIKEKGHVVNLRLLICLSGLILFRVV